MSRRATEPLCLSRTVLEAIQVDQIREHGGLFGLRDENALEAALARPRHKWTDEPTTDLASLGAAYASGIARNHPYSDGNKRIALVAVLTCLAINGQDVEAGEDDVLTAMLAFAARQVTEARLADWLRTRMSSIR